MRIGMLVENMDQNIINWFLSQAEEAEIELIHIAQEEDLNHTQALLCLAQDDMEKDWQEKVEKQRKFAAYAQDRGLPVIWAVENEDFQKAYSSITDFSKIEDVSAIWTLVLSLQNDFLSGKLKVIQNEPPEVLITEDMDSEGSFPDDPDEDLELQESRDQKSIFRSRIIAVGGPRGCGSSFISWNLAALLEAIILEGRTTDALAKWIKSPKNRDDVLKGGGGQAGVIADRPMSLEEFELARSLGGDVIIDVGDSLEGVWRQADVRVFVVTPDPKYQDIELPNDAILVLNRYPMEFPTRPENVFHHKFDLVVRDLGSEAFLKLWAGRPWIIDQLEEEQGLWRRIAS